MLLHASILRWSGRAFKIDWLFQPVVPSVVRSTPDDETNRHPHQRRRLRRPQRHDPRRRVARASWPWLDDRSACATARSGLLERPVEAVTLDPDRLERRAGAPGRHVPRQHQSRRSLRLSDARRQPQGPLRRNGRGAEAARPRRADRRRRRRQPRHPAQAAGALGHSLRRHSQDHRQRCRPHRARRRLLDRGRHRHRSARPACSRPAPATSARWCSK